MYTPDRWLVVKIETEEKPIYKVFATWASSYLSGQSWQMNSGIVSVTEDERFYYFNGVSGSIYKCHKETYGSFSYGASVLSNFMEKLEGKMVTMPEETNWLELEYD